MEIIMEGDEFWSHKLQEVSNNAVFATRQSHNIASYNRLWVE